MAEYTFSPQLLPRFKQQLTKQFFLVAVPLALFGFCYSYVIRHESFIFSLLINALGITALSIGLLSASKRTQQSIQSYRLIVEANSITRTQLNASTVHILASNITDIIEDERGAITIKTTNENRSITIIPQIAHRTQLLEELKLFTQSIRYQERSLNEKLAPFATLIIGVIIFSFYLLAKLFSS